MWFLRNMKFRHRVVAVAAVLFLLTLGVFLYLPYEASMGQLHEDFHGSFRGKRWSPLTLDPEMCRLTSSGPPHHSNISTYDLYYNTQFNLKYNGEWEMPTPSMEHLRSPRPSRLKVILLPHSHNDPGWLKTVNEYYSDQTKHILNNMVNKLTQFPNMTFIWTETVFFSIWWTEIEDAVKVQVRRLIRRGQLEITLGGWVMPDEASSHYWAVIDQMIEGHQWLWENLGVRPENSWSIDPFGYSGTMPYLWQKSGMSNMVIQRVHQAVKTSLVKERALEFYWRQMWDVKGSTDIFCHVMPFMLYNIKFSCGPNQHDCLKFDFRKIPGEISESLASEITQDNIEQSAEMLYHQYRAKAFYFRYNTILVPIGDDFRYDRDVEWDQQYENYEKLIKYMNSRPDWNVHVQWGTLKNFFQQVKKWHVKKPSASRREDFPVLSGDFFPYSDKDNAYWTGYYSTRPFDKFFSRDVQVNLQAADILNTLLYAFYKRWNINPDAKFSEHSSLLQQARRYLGVFLHHDAITGTSKPIVAEDYERYLLKAFSYSQEVIKVAIQSLLSKGKVVSPLVFQPEIIRRSHKELPEKQVIPVLESGTTVAFFNSLGQPRQQVAHLLVNTQKLEVVSSSGKVVPCQTKPVSLSKDGAVDLHEVFELTFLVEVGPFSITSYVLYKKSYQTAMSSTASTTVVVKTHENELNSQTYPFPNSEPPSLIAIDNQVIQLTFDPISGSLKQVIDLATKTVTQLNITFQVYESRDSGAYLFSPKGPAENMPPNIPKFKVSKGPLTTTVIVSFEPFITHKVTLYHHPPHLASAIFLENNVSIQSLENKELIMRLNTSINNTDLSYFTDQNGFQFIRRRTNRSLRTEANYYPMTSAIVLEDQESRLSLLSAQPHGVACLETGQVELMLDRQPVSDDRRGLGEGVRDIKTTISTFVILIEKQALPAKRFQLQYAALSLKALALSDMLQQPLLSYFTTVKTDIFFRTVTSLSNPLSCDISAINFRSLNTADLNYNGTSVIFHRRGYDCSFPSDNLICSLSVPTLTFENLLKDFNITSIRETTLTHTSAKRTLQSSDSISIAPMELAAFHFQFP